MTDKYTGNEIIGTYWEVEGECRVCVWQLDCCGLLLWFCVAELKEVVARRGRRSRDGVQDGRRLHQTAQHAEHRRLLRTRKL